MDARSWAVAIASTALLAGCLAQTSGDPKGSSSAPPTVAATRFVAFGDAGNGMPDQAKVAAAMAKVCAARGCDFGTELGDNIYGAGASSANDPQFDSKFEVPYANLTFPIWLVLGNHDNSQDPAESSATAGYGLWYQSGDNEVAYGKRTDRPSDKWHMPARFYSFNTSQVAFFGLDTNTLTFYDVPFPPGMEAPVMAQTNWIDGATAAAKQPWNIALGHHPYLSNGPHGNAGEYDGYAPVPGLSGDYAKTFYETHLCGKVDVFLAGHDHNLQWLSPTPGCAMTQVIAGGGGASVYDLPGSDAALFQKSTLGFWWFEVTANVLHGVAYDADGAVLNEEFIHKGGA